MATLHGKFVWFEHLSHDVDKARAFYGELFGWRTDATPMGAGSYNLIQNAGAGIGGLRAAMPAMRAHWMSYLSVADVDATVKAAQAAGAAVLMPPTDFSPVGRGATLGDPNGAVFSVWKGTQQDRPDTEGVAAGDWYWNECYTSDAQKALAFYEKVFGYSHDAMDMGPQGTYYILKKDGVARAGLMRAHQPGPPPSWLPYVSVRDCDACAQRAAALGATVMVPPQDIPEVGRFTVLMDPLGASIAAIHGKFTR